MSSFRKDKNLIVYDMTSTRILNNFFRLVNIYFKGKGGIRGQKDTFEPYLKNLALVEVCYLGKVVVNS